jgi:hypothetical protein
MESIPSTDGRWQRQNIIQPQNFCGRIKNWKGTNRKNIKKISTCKVNDCNVHGYEHTHFNNTNLVYIQHISKTRFYVSNKLKLVYIQITHTFVPIHFDHFFYALFICTQG